MEKEEYKPNDSSEIKENGKTAYLRKFGQVKVLKKHFKNDIVR